MYTKENILTLLKQCVEIESFYDREKNINEQAAAEMISLWFENNIPEFSIQKISVSENRYNLLIAPINPQILFCCHLDTVLPSIKNQTSVMVKEDRIYGLGTKDMKGGWVAAMITAQELLPEDREKIGFLFYCDEEYDQKGMESMVEQYECIPKSVKVFISPESRFNLGTGCRGYASFDVEFNGKSAHTSRPEQGVDAGECMRIFHENMKSEVCMENELGQTTLILVGGEIGTKSDSNAVFVSDNKIPDYAKGNFSMRISDSELTKEKLLEKIDRLLKTTKVVSSLVTFKQLRQPSFIAKTDLIGTFIHQAERAGFKIELSDPSRSGYNDVAMLSSKTGVPFLNFGPYGEGNHGPEEWVSLQSIRDTADVFKNLVSSL